MKKIEYTLVFFLREKSVLLGYKTRGLGKGLWNGFGGKVEPEEAIIDAAHRELKEECNLDANNLKQTGGIVYEDERTEFLSIIHVFISTDCSGVIKCSEEMNPIEWYKISELPFKNMWSDAKFWFHLLVNEKYFTVHVKYGKDGNLKSTRVLELDSIEQVNKNIYVN